jgi:hypothetical protein
MDAIRRQDPAQRCSPGEQWRSQSEVSAQERQGVLDVGATSLITPMCDHPRAEPIPSAKPVRGSAIAAQAALRAGRES